MTLCALQSVEEISHEETRKLSLKKLSDVMLLANQALVQACNRGADLLAVT